MKKFETIEKNISKQELIRVWMMMLICFWVRVTFAKLQFIESANIAEMMMSVLMMVFVVIIELTM